MAPHPSLNPLISDLTVSSLELDRRTAPADMKDSPLRKRASFEFALFHSKRFDGIISPLDAGTQLHARDPASTTQYSPGNGGIPATSVNNQAMLVLFGLLSAGLVLASIWFFFWAKNGGFRFRKGDWEDYKSTVLRRKGPNGTTLSGATKTTDLGGGSIAGTLDQGDCVHEKGGRSKNRAGKNKKNKHDEDVRAYRHEKPARVGGLNRKADGSYHDYSNTDQSDISTSQTPVHKFSKHKPRPRQYSYNPGAESTFSVYSDDSHRPLHASPAHVRHSSNSTPVHTPTRSRQPSPTKRSSTQAPPPAHGRHSSRTSVPGNYTDPIDFASRYTASEAETEQTRGTKAYFHPIPGLSKNGDGANGFRRGGGRRRDSLSDSEGETATVMS